MRIIYRKKKPAKQLTILLDLDGVTCDMIGPLLNIYNEEYNISTKNLKRSDINTWRLKPELKEIFQETPHFFQALPLIHGAWKGVRWLGLRHNLIICTDPSNNYDIARDKMIWLKCMGFDKYPLIMTPIKHIIDCDIIIDDSPHHIKSFIKANTGKLKLSILMDQPYNKEVINDITNMPQFMRAYNWDDIIEYVRWWEKFVS